MMITHKPTGQCEKPIDTELLPSTFDPAYVEGSVRPFFLSSAYVAEVQLQVNGEVRNKQELAATSLRHPYDIPATCPRYRDAHDS
jgi:hypothetical protein